VGALWALQVLVVDLVVAPPWVQVQVVEDLVVAEVGRLDSSTTAQAVLLEAVLASPVVVLVLVQPPILEAQAVWEPARF
jgi:hypothetical protein